VCKFTQVTKNETAQTKGECEIVLLSTPDEASILALVDNPTVAELKKPMLLSHRRAAWS
jgi:hypothetical protein